MKYSLRLSMLALASAGAILLAGCASSVPVQTMPQEFVATDVNSGEIHNAVLQAAKLRHWRVVRDEPGAVTLAYPTGKKAAAFEATVRVTYDDKTFQVAYLSSRGLNEKKGCYDGSNGFREDIVCAHRNVNNWMINLDRDIRRFLNPKMETTPKAAEKPKA